MFDLTKLEISGFMAAPFSSREQKQDFSPLEGKERDVRRKEATTLFQHLSLVWVRGREKDWHKVIQYILFDPGSQVTEL